MMPAPKEVKRMETVQDLAECQDMNGVAEISEGLEGCSL